MTATMARGSAAPRGGPLDHVQLHHVCSLDELWAFARWVGERHDGPVCFDTESDALNPHRDRHRMTQIGDKWSGWAFPPHWYGAAHEVLGRFPGRLGCWNGPYDTRVLGHQSGLWLNWAQIDDGQLVAHLADSLAPLKLKVRASRDIDPTAMAWERQLKDAYAKHGWDFATIPWDFPWYWMYGAADAVLTSWELDKHLPLVRQRYRTPYDIELAYARICANMMSAGLMVDRPWIAEWTQRISDYYERTMERLLQVGISSPHNNAEVGHALEAAGVQVQRTRTGQAAVNKGAMEAYEALQPHATALIHDIRYAKKAADIITRALTKFERLAVGDIMHYSIHSIGAQATGRSSVTEPAMQTFDRDVRVIRGCFIPRPGYRLISWDANQIELRLSAHISKDRALIAEIARCDANGLSFFLEFAGKVFGKISKADPRYTVTKNTVYSMTYGAGPETAAVTAGVPLEGIRPIYDGFKRAYPTQARYAHSLVSRLEQTRRRPHVTTLYGRDLMVRRGQEHAGVDYEVQGSAAELMKVGTIAMDAAGFGGMLRLTQHDEIIAEAPEEDAADVLRIGSQILTQACSGLSVPITWDGVVMEGRWQK